VKTADAATRACRAGSPPARSKLWRPCKTPPQIADSSQPSCPPTQSLCSKPRAARGFLPVLFFCDQNRQSVVKILTTSLYVLSRFDETCAPSRASPRIISRFFIHLTVFCAVIYKSDPTAGPCLIGSIFIRWYTGCGDVHPSEPPSGSDRTGRMVRCQWRAHRCVPSPSLLISTAELSPVSPSFRPWLGGWRRRCRIRSMSEISCRTGSWG
jgi:hypothetical protein